LKSDTTRERKDLEPLRENPEEYEVEEIVEQRRERYNHCYQLMYKCRWKDHSITDEWIPESYLRNAKEILEAWKRKLRELKLRE